MLTPRPSGRKKKREQFIHRRARELALSRRFERWQAIEFELRFIEGLPDATICLGNETIREELDSLCRQAKSKKPAQTSKKVPD
jgi:hypothetical protein